MNKTIAGSLGIALALVVAGTVPAGADEAPDLTVEEGIVMADQLDATADEWAGEAVEDIVEILPFDGQVYVLADGNEEELREALPDDVADDVEVVRGVLAPAAASPNADPNQWSGGNWINGSPYWCTAGFNFKRPTGEIVGSTAKHCLGGSWTNGGRVVGTTSTQAPGNDDFELIRSAAGTSFTYDVWIRGSNGKPALRYVQDAGINRVGDKVAHYGRTSGGGSGTITRITAEGRVYADCTTTRPGDSGGPVYTVLSSGRVEARGTLSGYVYIEKNGNNSFQEGVDQAIGMYYTDISRSMTDLGINLLTKDTVGAVPIPKDLGGTTKPFPFN